METITVTLAPERTRTRILMMCGANELLRAILGPPSQAHPRAAATLLEGLSLWYQRPLSVVLCADDSSDSSALELCDGLGFGRRTLHYEVGIAVRELRRRGVRLGGLGDFRELRSFRAEEVVR
ncbi:MAG TPA: hypothetical protein VGC98_16640 [Thermoleophilaceae bacterium]|jgi:hypothetical protein